MHLVSVCRGAVPLQATEFIVDWNTRKGTTLAIRSVPGRTTELSSAVHIVVRPTSRVRLEARFGADSLHPLVGISFIG